LLFEDRSSAVEQIIHCEWLSRRRSVGKQKIEKVIVLLDPNQLVDGEIPLSFSPAVLNDDAGDARCDGNTCNRCGGNGDMVAAYELCRPIA
jgi:hypothetical protein